MSTPHRTAADGTRSWRAMIRVDGKQITGSWRPSLELAQADERELLERRRAGRLVRSDQTLAEFLEADVAERERVSSRGTPLAGTTARRYREDHERICSVKLGRRLAGDLPVHSLRPLEIEQIRNGLLERGVGPRTVAANLSRICTALDRAVRDGLLPFNPATPQLVPRPRGPIDELPDDIGDRAPEILAAAMADTAHPWLDVAVHLGLLCGLRESEICGLKWSAVDLEHGTLHVREVQTRAGHHAGAKSSAGVRHVPIPAEAAAALRRQQTRQLERLGGVAETVIDRRGAAWKNPASIGQMFGKVAERGGFGDVTFHGLRHGCTQIMIAAGYSVEQIMRMLGWSRETMVTRYAGKLSKDQAARFAEGISAVVAERRRQQAER